MFVVLGERETALGSRPLPQPHLSKPSRSGQFGTLLTVCCGQGTWCPTPGVSAPRTGDRHRTVNWMTIFQINQSLCKRCSRPAGRAPATHSRQSGADGRLVVRPCTSAEGFR